MERQKLLNIHKSVTHREFHSFYKAALHRKSSKHEWNCMKMYYLKKFRVSLNSYSYASQKNPNCILHWMENRLHTYTQSICDKNSSEDVFLYYLKPILSFNVIFPKTMGLKNYIFNYIKTKDLYFELAFICQKFHALNFPEAFFPSVVYSFYPRNNRKSCLKL